MGNHEGTMQIKDFDISMKTRIILTGFGLTFGTSRFDEKSFFLQSYNSHQIGITNSLLQFMLIPQVYILVTKSKI